jgi:hypothetical protein
MGLTLVIILAAFSIPRLVRLIVEDTISDPIRERLFTKYPPHDAPGSYWQMTLPKSREEYAKDMELWRLEDAGREHGTQYFAKPARYNQYPTQVRAGTFLGDLISCPYCVGVWVSIAVTVMVLFVPYSFVILTPFALAQVSDIIIDFMQRG